MLHALRRLSLLVALTSAPSCGAIFDAAPLIAGGGERTLREPMRPIRGRSRVIVVALDGVSDPALRRAIAEARLPVLDSLLGERVDEHRWAHGYAAPNVTSVLPSMTIPGWTAVFTGEPPARTGIVGNEYFDREQRRFYAPAPGSVSGIEDAVRMLNEGLLGDDLPVPTLFERANVRAYATMTPIHRGVDVLTLASAFDLAKMLSIIPEGIAAGSVSSSAYRETDEDAIDEMLDAIEESGVPDLLVLYFPGIDLVVHSAEEPLETQQRYLQDVVDPSIAAVIDAYRAQRLLDDTYFVFVADHGHTPVSAVGAISNEESAAVLRRAGFSVRPFALESGGRPFSSVLAYQGGFAYVYLADRSSCPPCDWSQPPRFEEDVLVAARAFARELDSIDLVLARRPVPLSDDALPFEILEDERLVPIDDYLERHPRSDLVRFAERLEDLAAGPRGHRAGDVLLMSRLTPRVPPAERTYFAMPYHSFHGSASALDSIVPLLAVRQGEDGRALRALVESSLRGNRSHMRTSELVLRLLEITDASPGGRRSDRSEGPPRRRARR